MKISLLDRSMYLKGLMLLIRKDREIREEEKNLVMRVGETLGFEKSFCANAIEEILDNKYVLDEPPRFSTSDIAASFVRDGLRLSSADGEMHGTEKEWLRGVADTNGLDDKWYEACVAAVCGRGPGSADVLEATGLEWE